MGRKRRLRRESSRLEAGASLGLVAAGDTEAHQAGKGLQQGPEVGRKETGLLELRRMTGVGDGCPGSSVKPKWGWGQQLWEVSPEFQEVGVGGSGWHPAHTFSEALLAQAARVGKFVLGGGRVGMWHRAARHSCSGPGLRCSPNRLSATLQLPGEPGSSQRRGRGRHHPK